MIYLLGNCQMKVLGEYLRDIPGIDQEIKIWYVEDKLSELDLTSLRKSTVLYQNISSEAIQKHHGLNLESARNWSTEGLGIRGISFPSIYHSGYFPDFYLDPKYSIPGYNTSRQILERVKKGLTREEIYLEMTDPELYTKEQIEQHWNRCNESLRNRQQVDIPVVDYLTDHRSTRLMHTVNHPTREFFSWLVDLITEKLHLPSGLDVRNRPDKMIKYGRLPIFPSICSHLNMPFDDRTVFEQTEMDLKTYLDKMFSIFSKDA